MALQGTLKDFGIADIFQLIGQQTKTGVLHLKSRDEEVHIAFSNGAIVRADSASRRQRDLLGAMLLNGGFISQGQLDESLEAVHVTLDADEREACNLAWYSLPRLMKPPV